MTMMDTDDRLDPLMVVVRGLTAHESRTLGRYIPRHDLQRAVLHIGSVPWYLPQSFAAIARGKDIYFRPGIFVEGTPSCLALLGHELIHVGQYRAGMNAFRYLTSCAGGYGNSRYEVPAYAMQSRILGDLCAQRPTRIPAEIRRTEQGGAQSSAVDFTPGA